MKSSILLVDNMIDPKYLLEPFRGRIFPEIDLFNAIKYNVIAVYDVPVFLPFWYRELRKAGFKFKYHVVIYFDPLNEFKSNNLLVSHVGMLLVSKNSFNPKKVRIPHKTCKFCGSYLKDWGGKTHLMNPEGALISDVWRDFPLTYKDIIYKRCPQIVINRLKHMFENVDVVIGERKISQENIEEENKPEIRDFPKELENIVIQGDAIEELKKIPENSVDTIFIDPPYNLGKQYLSYEDERKDYVEWSLRWLEECFRILKPNGSLFLLNIPKWAYEISFELLPKYYIIRWIVWDETAEPRGKLIPAHYPLLWFSKTKDVKTYPLDDEQDSMDYCLRTKCIKVRRSLGIKDKISVRDVRWDIHRIKHRGKRFVFHPVQLPEKLLRFVIKLTTKEGDIVLDPMVGTGTTLAVAKKLNRLFLGIDIDPTYVEITKKRLRGELEDILERVERNNLKDKKFGLTKKWIQIKMKELAEKIGRLPTIEEASQYLGVDKSKLSEIFPSWSKALKMAKMLQMKLDAYKD